MKKLLIAFFILSGTFTAFSSIDTAKKIHMTAANIQRDGSTVHLKGQVLIETNQVLLRADEADYHTGTQEIEARGNVKVRLLYQASQDKEKTETPTSDQ